VNEDDYVDLGCLRQCLWGPRPGVEREATERPPRCARRSNSDGVSLNWSRFALYNPLKMISRCNRRTVLEIRQGALKQGKRGASRLFHSRGGEGTALLAFNVSSIVYVWLSLSTCFQGELAINTNVVEFP